MLQVHFHMLYFNQEAVARRGAFRQLSPCAGNVALRRYWTSGIGALLETRRTEDLRIDPIISAYRVIPGTWMTREPNASGAE
jgi:hypothetical protein